MFKYHIEIVKKSSSKLKKSELEDLVKTTFKNPEEDLNISNNENIQKHIENIKIYPADEINCSLNNKDENKDEKLYNYHIFELNDEDPDAEFMEDDEENSQSPSSHHWILPSKAFHGLWDSLIFDTNIKQRLLQYIKTALLFSERKVDNFLIDWNKVILLYGPPGTGKTSLCKALAQKATIRNGDKYKYGQLIEINSHSLFSKWFSESGKLIMKMFEKINELIEDSDSLVFLLIDEVESLAKCRISAEAGNEPSDSIRAVNALLTQLDKIKNYPNVLILTTSNIVGTIDLAFVDRADLKIHIGNPPIDIIFQIYASSLNELIRTGIITNNKDIKLKDEDLNSKKLYEISSISKDLSGRTLRKIPFLAYSSIATKGIEICPLELFLDEMKETVHINLIERERLINGN